MPVGKIYLKGWNREEHNTVNDLLQEKKSSLTLLGISFLHNNKTYQAFCGLVERFFLIPVADNLRYTAATIQ